MLSETLKEILLKEKLDGLIAYAAGTTPLRPRPAFFTTSEACDKAIFDGFCVQNLANYLHRHRDNRVGILVKGCDRRAIRVLVQEKQIKRENLFLIGIPCPGMLNRNQLLGEFPDLQTSQVREEGESLIIATPDGPRKLGRNDYLLPTCRACRHRVPSDVDVLLDPPPFTSPEADLPFSDQINSIATMGHTDRADLFREELSRCILCYACRNVCPLCYCETCFTDSLQPTWMTSTPEPDNIFFYHVNRMMHMAGRCVACGSCEWACPEHIPLRFLYGKITVDVEDLFAYEAGLDASTPQPLSYFSEDDPDEHIN